MTSLMLEPVSGEGATPGELQAEEPRSNKEHLGVGAWLAIAWLALMLVFAVLGEHLGLLSKNDFNPRLKLAPPFTAGHLLGTDNVGHDMLAYVVYGTKVSVGVGVISVAIGTVIGGFFGLISGYFRNIFTVGLGYMFDVLLAFPPLVLSLTLVTVLAYDPAGSEWRRFAAVVAGLAIVSIPILARITRANTLVWSEREFVLAAKAMGAKSGRILFRDVLPNVIPAMMSIAILGIGIAIVAEGSLSLFGVSVKPDTPSWGNIIASQRGKIATAPHVVFVPVIFLFLTVLSLNYLGDVIRKRFDVRESIL